MAILVRKSLSFKLIHCIKDNYGQFVLIKAAIHREESGILNVYGLPGHPLNFLTDIMSKLADLPTNNIIKGGDFNCLKNPLIDRLVVLSLPFHRLDCEQLGYVDVWKTLHPAVKEYTFFSNPHTYYSRIYYFFTPKQC